MNEEKLSGALEQLFTFYEQIILCRELNLCDDAVAQQFFDEDGLAFVHTFYPYICDIRAQWNNPEKFERVLDFYVQGSKTICKSAG